QIIWPGTKLARGFLGALASDKFKGLAIERDLHHACFVQERLQAFQVGLVRFQFLTDLAVDREFAHDVKNPGLGQAEVGEKTNQGNMVVVDAAIGSFDFLQSGVQYCVDNSLLLIAEQRLKRIDISAKVAVEKTYHFRCVSAAEGL